MRKSLFAPMVVMLLAIFTYPAAAQDATAGLATAIEALSKAFEERDSDSIRAMMTPDHVAVSPGYGRAYSVDEQIATLPELDYKVFDSSGRTISLLGEDAALITERSTIEGSFKGEPLARHVFISEVWVRQDGKWLQRLYQETAVKAE